MQYDVKKLLENNKMLKLQWHGDETKVRLSGEAEKVVVKTGDVIEVSVKDAKMLLQYSSLWTLEGDKPLNPVTAIKKSSTPGATKPLLKAELQAKLKELGVEFKPTAKLDELRALLVEATKDTSTPGATETSTDVAKMSREQLVAALQEAGQTFNDKATEDELRALLTELLSENK